MNQNAADIALIYWRQLSNPIFKLTVAERERLTQHYMYWRIRATDGKDAADEAYPEWFWVDEILGK